MFHKDKEKNKKCVEDLWTSEVEEEKFSCKMKVLRNKDIYWDILVEKGKTFAVLFFSYENLPDSATHLK